MKKIKWSISAILFCVLFAHAELMVSETRVYDDFNRRVGAGSQATLGTDVWMNGFSDGSQWGITDDQVFANLRKGSVGLLVNSALKIGDEFVLSADVKALQDSRWAGLLFHYIDQHNYSCFRFKSGTGNWSVMRMVNGVKQRVGANGKYAEGLFQANTAYTLTVSSTEGRLELKITETASGSELVSDWRSMDGAAEGLCGLFQSTPGNDLVHFDNFSLKIPVPVRPVSKLRDGLSFAPIFNNGSVLQCEMPVNIWGTATPGETVTVSFAGQKKSAVANDSGRWLVILDPLKASAEPRSLHVSSFESQVSLNDVVVGEVWLASGQSNMVQPLENSHNGPDRLAQTIPDIHFVIVPQKTGLPVEQPLTAEELGWKSFSPETNEKMASVAFYFAEQIQQKTGRQVGIIQSSYGGTPCEAWTPQTALAAHPNLKYMADQIAEGLASGKSRQQWLAEIDTYSEVRSKWQSAPKNNRPPKPEPVSRSNPWWQQSPTVLYENMIAPLIPYTTRGVIWYQGEANAGKPDEYRVLFPAMIEAWRTKWNRPDWPFFFVQLAAYGHPSALWKELCVSQAFVRDTVDNTGMAVAIDCGDKKNIHPHTKQPVGERLARLALDQVYGRDIASRGPVFQGLEKKDDRILVHFQYSDPSGAREALPYSQQGSDRKERQKGLKASDGKAEIPGFELAGADRKFKPAIANIISGDTVEVVSPDVADPAYIRYAWDNFPDPPVTLQNSAGLPTEPFSVTIEN